jgi:hypothetical protein
MHVLLFIRGIESRCEFIGEIIFVRGGNQAFQLHNADMGYHQSSQQQCHDCWHTKKYHPQFRDSIPGHRTMYMSKVEAQPNLEEGLLRIGIDACGNLWVLTC